MRGDASAALSSAILGVLALACADDATATRPDPEPEPPGVCAAHAFTGAGVRFFVVQPKIRPEVYVSHDAYRDHVLGLVEAQVVPCLAPDRPNVLVFPENFGLHAAFVGSRGAAARAASTSIEAFVALIEPYAGAVAYYQSAFGALGLAEGLVLALTDTLWRAFDGTCKEVARRTGAWVVANADVAGAIEERTDAASIAALADPDLAGAGSVYAASARGAYNTAYVYAPDGTIVARRSKPYLVESEEATLTLSYGRLEEVRPVDLGFARLGIVTSKDAWMPDVVDRLDALGTDVLVQPEAFSGWGVEELAGDWLPEVVAQSGFAATQKHGGIRYAVIPHMTGNLFDLVFDGQSVVFGDAAPGSARHAYVGMAPMPGVVAVAPWLAADPGVADPSLSLEARRAALRAAGEAALPGGANANGYVETVIAADLELASAFPASPDGAPGALGRSVEVAPAEPGTQVAPRLAVSGERVWVVWASRVGGSSRIRVARSEDGGATFGAPATVAEAIEPQRLPAVAASGDAVAIAWQEGAGGGSRVLVARSEDGGATFGRPESPTGAWGPGADEWVPSIALADDGSPIVAFVAMSDANERVVVARPHRPGWRVVRADPEAPAWPPMNTRNNQWSPAIAVSGGDVAVAWVDFRAYQWDLYVARSSDGGATFAPPARADDATDMPERIHDDPRVAFDAAGDLFVAWTDVRLRRAPAGARLTRVSAIGIETSTLLAGGDARPPAWRPAVAARPGGGWVAAWQDLRGESNDVFIGVAGPGGLAFAEHRLDDGTGAAQALRPDIAVTGSGRAVVVWEDTRSGARRVRAAAGPPP